MTTTSAQRRATLAYFERNPTTLREIQKRYYATHADQIREQQRDYYLTNRDTISARRKIIRDEKKEKEFIII